MKSCLVIEMGICIPVGEAVRGDLCNLPVLVVGGEMHEGGVELREGAQPLQAHSMLWLAQQIMQQPRRHAPRVDASVLVLEVREFESKRIRK